MLAFQRNPNHLKLASRIGSVENAESSFVYAAFFAARIRFGRRATP
jgi:hypothetical protein